MFQHRSFIEAYETGEPVPLQGSEVPKAEEALRAEYLPPDERLSGEAVYMAINEWNHRKRLVELLKSDGYNGGVLDITIQRLDDPVKKFMELGPRTGRVAVGWLPENMIGGLIQAKARGRILRPVWYQRNNPKGTTFKSKGTLWTRYVGEELDPSALES